MAEADNEAPHGWSYAGKFTKGPHEGQQSGHLHNVQEKIPLGEEVEVIDREGKPTGDWAVITDRWPSEPYEVIRARMEKWNKKRKPGRPKKAKANNAPRD